VEEGMGKEKRYTQIVEVVDQHGYISVNELSRILDVSEMTIRRDLAQLHEDKRLRRTYGGAASMRENGASPEEEPTEPDVQVKAEFIQVDEVDVLIATSVDPYYDKLLLDRVGKKNIPIIAESLPMPNQHMVVSVDNYQAGLDLGRETGRYLRQNGFENANLLDLTFHLANTKTRSQGFANGLGETFPTYQLVLSINAQSRAASAYQITYDALTVHQEINLIFAINDSTARGAIQACKDLKLSPDKMVVVTFGLAGDTLRETLVKNSFLKLGLAMFPEVVALACIDAALSAHLGDPLPEQYITPHVVLSPQSLSHYYTHTTQGWRLNWEMVRAEFPLLTRLEEGPCFSERQAEVVIGLIVPFSEHEWYMELTHYIQENAKLCGANLQIIDADQNVQDEIELRRQSIARKAASLVNVGDVVLIDGGPMAIYLANELREKSEITVITNSIEVFNTLNQTPNIILMSTGGAVRYSSQVLVGPTAESALTELRADKLFLMVGGISLDFGLSHTNISEVTIKQAMIRSAHQVILLADHTSFSIESIIQVAPLSVLDVIITDDALPPNFRLDLTKAGIELLLA
jgi:DeoR/GlpR family transcriptional regulator of sugar metabolism